jgi:hypothetical protein
MRIALVRPPVLARLRDSTAAFVDHLWFALAVALGLVLAYWICALLGLPSPLAPVEEIRIL